MAVLVGTTVLGWLITVGLAFVPILGWIVGSCCSAASTTCFSGAFAAKSADRRPVRGLSTGRCST